MSPPDVLPRNAIVIDQEPGREVTAAAWNHFSVQHQIISVLGISENYTADYAVGIIFESGRAQFCPGPGEEDAAAALAVAFAARFGGTMTIPAAMADAVRRASWR